jgi:nicotinate-nucleotide--dimethylbenzimidazole phosphoribosyltransferase
VTHRQTPPLGRLLPVTTPADLQALAADVRPTGRAAEQQARRVVDDLLLPVGALGELTRLAVWWAGVRGDAAAPPPSEVTALVVAGDHGIAVRGVSALPLGHTAVTVRALRDGRSATHAAAAVAGARVRTVEVDVAGPRGPRSAPFDVGDSVDEALLGEAVDLGASLADELAGQGLELLVLGELNVGGSTTAAALVGAAQRRRVLEVVGRGSGVDDTAWMRKAAAVREGLRRARTRPRDVPSLLRAVGSADAALMTALLLRCAALRLPVLLDGPVSAAAAVLAHRVSPTARQWWLFPERGDEPCVHRAQDALGMVPVHALGTRTGLGVAGLTALGTLRAASAVVTASASHGDYWPRDPDAPEPTEHDVTDEAPADAPTDDEPADDEPTDGEAAAQEPQGERSAEVATDEDLERPVSP